MELGGTKFAWSELLWQTYFSQIAFHEGGGGKYSVGIRSII